MVPGNHEYYLYGPKLAAFESDMQACGAHLLVNEAAVLEKNGQKYLLAGMDDMARYQDYPRAQEIGAEQYEMEVSEGFMQQIAQNTPQGDFPLKIMLCHEPPYWQLWEDAGYNLALCGHLHGWIFREPGIGGVLRRPSLYFPEEDAGLYNKQGLMVYISRGLDSRANLTNFRLNNQPELALIEVVGK
jgi:predicted MPP superfamily phosphohydrolase